MTILYQTHVIMRSVIKELHCISLLVWKPSIVCLVSVQPLWINGLYKSQPKAYAQSDQSLC